jgi:hypothetical protein
MRVGGGLRELASGVDALYCSGRGVLADSFLWGLGRAREEAEITEREVPVPVGDAEFRVQGHGLGKYRYNLAHEHGVVGVSPSVKLPALRIQPRAAFIHAVGAREAVGWFRRRFEQDCFGLRLTASRMDLHADWQGWDLRGDDRQRFVCRSEDLVTHEHGDLLSGFQFGHRKNKTISGRIYDKTRELRRSGADYWEEIWGSRFDPEQPVLRVEFEFGRQGLSEFGVSSPEEAIDAAGGLWSYAADDWLSLRTPTSDTTKSRWPVDPAWEQVRRASIADSGCGVERMYEGLRRGQGRMLVPLLVGCVVSYAAVFGFNTVEDSCSALVDVIRESCVSRGLSFEKRVLARRREFGLP